MMALRIYFVCKYFKMVASETIFLEKSLSVPICLSHPIPIPFCPKKVTRTENFTKKSCHICFEGYVQKHIHSHAATATTLSVVLSKATSSYVLPQLGYSRKGGTSYSIIKQTSVFLHLLSVEFSSNDVRYHT